MTSTLTSAAAVEETAADSDAPETITFKGATFATADEVSEYAIIEFAEAVDSGLDSGSFAGFAAVLRLVVALIAEPDRRRFRAVARRESATFEDLFALLKGDVEENAERPTGLSVDSSAGQVTTSGKSGASFVGKGSPLAGRPDLLIAVEDAVRRAA